MHLYETHLPVTNTHASTAFCVDVVGLTLAYRDPSRDIAFLWIGENRSGGNRSFSSTAPLSWKPVSPLLQQRSVAERVASLIGLKRVCESHIFR
jgi:hypothetical protein